jgi:hypothetical protein
MPSNVELNPLVTVKPNPAQTSPFKFILLLGISDMIKQPRATANSQQPTANSQYDA